MAVVELEVTSRTPYVGGQPFEDVGAYELFEGTAGFAVGATYA